MECGICWKKKEGGDDTKLEVIIWPEPYCFAKTEEEKKQRKEFEFSASGVEMAADWLNEQYVEQKPLWELSKKMKIWIFLLKKAAHLIYNKYS